MKKLLLIGDSVRMGYDRCVAMALEGKAQVLTPAENCRFAEYTYSELGTWEHNQRFGPDVDVIHWNVGLHDVRRFHGDPPMTPPEIYGYYLERIILRLKDLYPGARQIFALTTPVRDEKYTDPWFSRKDADVVAINRTARAVAEKYGIPVNDLYAAAKTRDPDEIFNGAVHFNYAGSKLLAEAVLRAVCPALGVEADLMRIRPETEDRTDILQ